MEQRGFRLGSIGGTSLNLELSFLILSGLFVIISLEGRTPLPYALLWIPTLFLNVLVHELGHAAVIGLLGFGSSQILLSGFGGLTINERRARPWQDILISAAGPLASIAFAQILKILYFKVSFFNTDAMFRELIPLMIRTNYAWAILNLLPIYPLDGGQILRNLARILASERRAFAVSVWTSIFVGIGLTVFGLTSGSFFLAAIAGMLVLQNYQRWQLFRDNTSGDD